MTATIDFTLVGDPHLAASDPYATSDGGALIDPGTTAEQQAAFAGIQLGALVGKLALITATDVKTGEKKAVLVALPPAELANDPDYPPIPIAVLIDGDPFEQYAPGHGEFIDLDTYRAAVAVNRLASKRAA